MFGYITTDFPNLFVKDTVLYKAVYCGLCKSIGKTCGVNGRFLLNYDLTFLSVFVHNVSGVDFKVEKQRCVLHTFTKRPVALPDELSKRIAALNVILAYYKLSDDIIDSGRGKIKRSLFNKAYKRAKKLEPVLDQAVKESYEKLIEYERKNCDSIDLVADPFGEMMKKIVGELLSNKFSEEISVLSYNLGKWIYLIDAVDDFDKDKKSGSFNVFINAYKDVADKKTFLENKKTDLEMVFGGVLSQIYSCAKKISYNFNHDLTDNILFKGIFEQTKRVMENRKCKNIIKF